MGDETFSGAAHAIINPVEQGFSFQKKPKRDPSAGSSFATIPT